MNLLFSCCINEERIQSSLLCFRRFLCVHVSVWPIDTQKGNNALRLLRDTHQGLLHIAPLQAFSQ